MVNAVYCRRCKKIFPEDKTCKIKMEISCYTEIFEDDFCIKCKDKLEGVYLGD
jgi:hypothetical protein